MLEGLRWTPRDGDTIHLNPRNRWHLPAGRYRLVRAGDTWALEGIACDGRAVTSTALLIAAETATTLTPMDRETLAREAEEIRLALHAPLQGNRRGRYCRQHDASDLALFRTTNEPGLL